MLIANQSGIIQKLKKKTEQSGRIVLIVASAQKRILELLGEMDENDDENPHMPRTEEAGRGGDVPHRLLATVGVEVLFEI